VTEAERRWTPARPNALVVACSDGRLQEATDAFLEREFKITRYDRFYVPGGGGALASSGADPVRAQQEADAVDLLKRRREWASDAGVLLYRCEVDAAGRLAFVNLDPDSALGSEKRVRGAWS
jgi:hypothetical protein